MNQNQVGLTLDQIGSMTVEEFLSRHSTQKPKTNPPSFKKLSNGGWAIRSDTKLNPGDYVKVQKKSGSVSEKRVGYMMERSGSDYIYEIVDSQWIGHINPGLQSELDDDEGVDGRI